MNLLWFLVTGAVVGTFSGLLGVGGGFIAVPILIFCLGMDTKMAMGTSLVAIVPMALTGGYKQYVQEHVDLKAALCIAIAGMAFAYIGAHLNDKLSEVTLNRILGVIMLGISLKMIVGK